MRSWTSVVQGQNKYLVVRRAACGQRPDISDLAVVRRKDAGFGPGCEAVFAAWRQAKRRARLSVRHSHAVVDYMSNAPAVGTPGERRRDGPWIARELGGGTAIGRHRPQLHDASIIFHEEGDAGTVRGTAQPMAWSL